MDKIIKRPIHLAVTGWLFIIAGAIGFFYHLPETDLQHPAKNDALWVLALRLLAVIGGVLTIRGNRYGRWMLIGWMAYHTVLGYFHSIAECLVHLVLLLLTIVALYYPSANVFFHDSRRRAG